MRALAIATLLVLSGCGPREKAEEQAAPEKPAGPHLGEVPLDRPLRATDNALTWSLEVAPGSITWTRFAGRTGEGSVTQFYPVSPKVEDDRAIWSTKDPLGTPVTITLTNNHCTEGGAPTIERPLTAELKIGEKVLHGCAGSRPADGLNSQPLPEQGNAADADNAVTNEADAH